MTRTLHVIDSLNVGGAQTHLVTMLRAYQQRGQSGEHGVLSLFGDGPIGDEIRSLEIKVEALDLATSLRNRRYWFAVRQIQDRIVAYSPQLVEAHLTYSRVLGLSAALRAKVPQRIAFEHGDLYLSSPKFRIAHYVAQHFASRVIVVSNALADWARSSYRLSSQRSTILHNCVDLDRFSIEESAPLDDLNLPNNATKVVAVGTLGTGVNKRVDVLIRAVAEARRKGASIVLVVCGDGELRPKLEQLAEDLDVRDYIHFLGMRPDVPRVLATCDVFALGTEFDPFPIAGLEALAMGLPIIVPDRGGMVEAVEPYLNGLIYSVLDHHSLANQLVWMHQHPKERERMSVIARQSAEERFSLDWYISELDALYGRV